MLIYVMMIINSTTLMYSQNEFSFYKTRENNIIFNYPCMQHILDNVDCVIVVLLLIIIIIIITTIKFLSYERSIASSQTSSPERASQCLLSQFTVSFRFLKVIQQLLKSSSSSSRLFYLSFSNVFGRQFARKI